MSIISTFFFGAGMFGAALFASFFLKEIPLRVSHREEPLLDKIDQELDAELAQMEAKDEPEII